MRQESRHEKSNTHTSALLGIGGCIPKQSLDFIGYVTMRRCSYQAAGHRRSKCLLVFYECPHFPGGLLQDVCVEVESILPPFCLQFFLSPFFFPFLQTTESIQFRTTRERLSANHQCRLVDRKSSLVALLKTRFAAMGFTEPFVPSLSTALCFDIRPSVTCSKRASSYPIAAFRHTPLWV